MNKLYLKKYNNLINSKKIVIIYFNSNECSDTNDIFLDFEKNNKNFILLERINVEENQELVKYLDLKCYPFFYIYKNGKLIDQILGTLDIEKILSQYLNT
jgi:thioredoxin-like negative regulator of GroEL